MMSHCDPLLSSRTTPCEERREDRELIRIAFTALPTPELAPLFFRLLVEVQKRVSCPKVGSTSLEIIITGQNFQSENFARKFPEVF